jgi:sec-independent protein translocase protein TatA
MGFSGISLTQLLVVLAIVLLVFGTKRVKSLGSDLGGAIRGFRKAMDADGYKGKHDANDITWQQHIQSAGLESDAQASGRTDREQGG